MKSAAIERRLEVKFGSTLETCLAPKLRVPGSLVLGFGVLLGFAMLSASAVKFFDSLPRNGNLFHRFQCWLIVRRDWFRVKPRHLDLRTQRVRTLQG